MTAGRHQVLEQRRRREAGLAELQVQLALDRQRHVVADHVEQLEGPHRVTAAHLHRRVDVVGARVVRLEHLHRVVEVGEEQRVDDETRAVTAAHGVLADLGGDVENRRLDIATGRHGRDDLDQLHDRGGIEEVHADDIGGSRGRGGALDHGQAGCRRREHSPGGADVVEVGEEHLLDRQILDDGLDDELDVGEIVQLRRAGHPRQRRVAVGLGELAALDALLQRAGDRGDYLRGLLGATGHEHHVVAGLGEHFDDAGGHGARADDAHRRYRARTGERAAGRRGHGVGHHGRGALGVVGVETAAALTAEQTGRHHLLEDRLRRVQPVARLLVHRVEDLVRGVEPDQVEQRERTHRQPAPELHGRVDVLAGGVARLVQRRRVVEIAEKQRVGDEPGAVTDGDVDLAELLYKGFDVVDDVLLGDDAADDLDQLHDRRRVEEMQADDLAGAPGCHRNLGDRQRGGVRRQDRLGLTDLV